jgi:hypothetical protein
MDGTENTVIDHVIHQDRPRPNLTPKRKRRGYIDGMKKERELKPRSRLKKYNNND